MGSSSPTDWPVPRPGQRSLSTPLHAGDLSASDNYNPFHQPRILGSHFNNRSTRTLASPEYRPGEFHARQPYGPVAARSVNVVHQNQGLTYIPTRERLCSQDLRIHSADTYLEANATNVLILTPDPHATTRVHLRGHGVDPGELLMSLSLLYVRPI